MPLSGHLLINETFLSVQGESSHAGRLCAFIRLMGCPLRCSYCDTEYAFHEGQRKSFAELFSILQDYGVPLVEVTGGEPLAQTQCADFLEQLVERGYEVLLETSGAFSTEKVPAAVKVILDVKTPGSGEQSRMDWDNLGRLKPGVDEVKFVICDRRDFDFALGVCEQFDLLSKVTVLLSPSHAKLPAKDLAEWMIASKKNFRLQLQMHKFIWGAEVRGV